MKLPYVPKTFFKNPTSTTRFEFRWARWLAARGVTIASATVESNDPALVVESFGNAAGVVYVYVSGGVLKSTYTLTCTVVTAGGAAPMTETRKAYVSLVDM